MALIRVNPAPSPSPGRHLRATGLEVAQDGALGAVVAVAGVRVDAAARLGPARLRDETDALVAADHPGRLRHCRNPEAADACPMLMLASVPDRPGADVP